MTPANQPHPEAASKEGGLSDTESTLRFCEAEWSKERGTMLDTILRERAKVSALTKALEASRSALKYYSVQKGDGAAASDALAAIDDAIFAAPVIAPSIEMVVKRLLDPPFGTETSERLLMGTAADAIRHLQGELAAAWEARNEAREGYMIVHARAAERDQECFRLEDEYVRTLAERDEARAVLKRADEFISNGIELGFIRMPDENTPDPAHDTPGIIRAALSLAQGDRT